MGAQFDMGRRKVNASLAKSLAAAADSNARAWLICDFINRHGNTYYDSTVTQKEHALQTATLALEEDANSSLIIAALLHDVGHLLLNENADNTSFLKKDLRHQNVVKRVLNPYVSKAVTCPIALHVAAKRYLCSTDPSYYSKLSPKTKQSLAIQGAAMTPTELARFERGAYFKPAVRLRRWDDAAKEPKKTTPDLAFFLPRLELELERAFKPM